MKEQLSLFYSICFFWLEIAFLAGLLTFLRSGMNVNPYSQIFLWAVSPLLVVYGIIFVKPKYKRDYFNDLKIRLLTR